MKGAIASAPAISASVGGVRGGSSAGIRVGGIEGGMRGAGTPTFSSRSFAEFGKGGKATTRVEAKPLINIRETGGKKVASTIKENTPVVDIHRKPTAIFQNRERGMPQIEVRNTRQPIKIDIHNQHPKVARIGGEKDTPIKIDIRRDAGDYFSHSSQRTQERRPVAHTRPQLAHIRVEVPQPVKRVQEVQRERVVQKPEMNKGVPVTPERTPTQVKVTSEAPKVHERIIAIPQSRSQERNVAQVNRQLAPIRVQIPSQRQETHPTPRVVIDQTKTASPQRREGKQPQVVNKGESKTPEMPVKQVVTMPAEKRQVVPQERTIQAKTPVKVEKIQPVRQIITKDQAKQVVDQYSQQPKQERKLTPQVIKAFAVASEVASPVAKTVLHVLSQEKTQPQPAEDKTVSTEMADKVRSILEAQPELKESIQNHLKVAMDVYVGYIAIGYAAVTASRIVMDIFLERVQKEVEKAKKEKTDVKPGFPPPNEPGADDDDKPEKPEKPEQEEAIEEEPEEVEFIRADQVNTKRGSEIDKLIENNAYTQEETGYQVVNGEHIASQMQQKRQTTSPILVGEGTPEDNPVVDGSFEEIRKDIKQEVKDQTDIQRARAQIQEIIRRHTAVAAGNPQNVTERDVEKVLTVPVEMTAFRMNNGRTIYRKAA